MRLLPLACASPRVEHLAWHKHSTLTRIPAIEQTNVSAGSNGRYDYHVRTDLYGDVLQHFVDATSARGIGHGFYYSLTNNFKLNVLTHNVQPGPLLPGQLNVTQQEFEDFAFNSVAELWSRYGNLTEIWLSVYAAASGAYLGPNPNIPTIRSDGGYTGDMQARLTKLLADNQPNAVCFGGFGISTSPARWCGTESGNSIPGYPDIWSTAIGGYQNAPPNASGAAYAPSGVDFTLQQGDHWFWTPTDSIHSLADLIDVYHNSVGHNGKLELDFAISRTGQLAPTHVARYAQLGAWIKSCYGAPLASVAPPAGATSAVLTLGASAVSVDRVMLQEDLTAGQRVYGYAVDFDAGDGVWQPFSAGLSIGNKRIDVLGAPVSATRVRVTLGPGALAPPMLSNFAAFAPAPCALPSSRVRFVAPDGRCLVSNNSFPCAGGAGNACPVFLGDCAALSSVWDDGAGTIMNVWASTQGGAAGLNVDCDATAPGAVVKLLGLGAGGYNDFAFANGQIHYGGTDLCLDVGQGPFSPPCGSEPRATDQVSTHPCAAATTAGWTRALA